MHSAEDEREAVVRLVRQAGLEAVRMRLVAGMPGDTRTDRAKAEAFADGCSHACKSILEAIEQGAHLQRKEGLG
jgi:hypothetical protein